MPGARYHHHNACAHEHIIRPALYAFWAKAPPELRRRVTDGLGTDWSSMEEFVSWCVASDEVNSLPNHILLFWFIAKLWGSFD